MKIVWVTGAHGFLGRNLCRHLSKKAYRVFGIGHGDWRPDEAEKWGISHWFHSSVTLGSLVKVESTTGTPEAIFHLAGGSSVSKSIEDPYLEFMRTVGTAIDVLEFVHLKSPDTKLIYPSSTAVYGSVDTGRIPENSSLNPVSPYGVNKQIVEILMQSYATQFHINISLIRFFSLYGNGMTKQLLWDICCKFRKDKGDIILHGTGDEIRDLVHIDDAVNLLEIAMGKASNMSVPVNGGTGIGTTIRAIAEEVRNHYDRSRKIIFNGISRKGDPKFYQAETKRTEAWGWEPTSDLRNGIRDYVSWFKEIHKLL